MGARIEREGDERAGGIFCHPASSFQCLGMSYYDEEMWLYNILSHFCFLHIPYFTFFSGEPWRVWLRQLVENLQPLDGVDPLLHSSWPSCSAWSLSSSREQQQPCQVKSKKWQNNDQWHGWLSSWRFADWYILYEFTVSFLLIAIHKVRVAKCQI